MLLRRVAALGVGWVAAAGAAGGQTRPAELPPLLTPPPATPAPPPGPRAGPGPAGEYDHAHLYLPDYRPAGGPAEPRGLLARWRARVADLRGSRPPGWPR
jgi:hypothetical protein